MAEWMAKGILLVMNDRKSYEIKDRLIYRTTYKLMTPKKNS